MQNLFEDEEARIKPRRNQQRPDIDKFQSMLHQVMGGKQPVEETLMDIDEDHVERIGAPKKQTSQNQSGQTLVGSVASAFSSVMGIPTDPGNQANPDLERLSDELVAELGSTGMAMELARQYSDGRKDTEVHQINNERDAKFLVHADFYKKSAFFDSGLILIGATSILQLHGIKVPLFNYPLLFKTVQYGCMFAGVVDATYEKTWQGMQLPAVFANESEKVRTKLQGQIGKSGDPDYYLIPQNRIVTSLLRGYKQDLHVALFNPLQNLFAAPSKFNIATLLGALFCDCSNLCLLSNVVVSQHAASKVFLAPAATATGIGSVDWFEQSADVFRDFRHDNDMITTEASLISLDHAELSEWYKNASVRDLSQFLSLRVQALTEAIGSLLKLTNFKLLGVSDLSIYLSGESNAAPEDITHIQNLEAIKNKYARSMADIIDTITAAAKDNVTSESLLQTMGDLNLKLQAAYAKNATLSAEISRNRKALYKMEKQGGGSNPRSGSMNNLSEEDARKEKRATESLWRTHVTLAVHNDFRKYHFVRFTRMVAGFQGQNNEFRLLNVDISDSIIEKIVSELKFGKGKDTSLIGGEAQATLVSLRSRLEDMIKSEKEPYAPYLNLDDEDSSECVYLQATNVLRDGMMQALNYVRDCQLESDENALLLDMKYFTTIEEKERDPTKVKLQSIFAEMVSAIITVIDETQKKVTTTAKQHVYRTEYLSRIKLEMRAALIRAGYDIKPNTYAPSKRHQVYF